MTEPDPLAQTRSLADVAAGPDIAEGLRAALALRRLADYLESVQVARARAAGWSWQRIASSLDVSKQAAHKKHSHLDGT